MQQQESKIDLRRLWRSVRQCRWFYLAAIVLFTSLGIWLSVRSLPKYEINGQMLIGEIGYDQDSKGGGIAQMIKTFSVGGFSASTVDNEVLIMQSHDVMLRTVRALGLNRTYIGKDVDGKKAMLYKETPVRVEAPVEFFDTLSIGITLKIKLNNNGTADIKATTGMFSKKLSEQNGVRLPHLFKTPYGALNIMPVDSLIKTTPYNNISVNITSNDIAATKLYEESEIEVATKLSDIININFHCANPDLGKAIVNGIMTEYNAKRLDRLHEASLASIRYYDDRIAETFKALQIEEQKVSEYQRKNDFMGVDSELELLVGEAVNSKTIIQNANHNIAYYEMVLSILRNKLDEDVIIPQMESLNDPNIGAFNGTIMTRRELRRSATDDNEALILLNAKIEELRNLIIENSEKMIAKAKDDVQHQQNIANIAQGRLDEYPGYQLEFKNLLRDKEYQNQLYQYLVSQRENSVLQLYSTTNIGFVFQGAYVVKKAGLLSKLVMPIALFVFALFAVTCLAFFLMMISRKIKDPIDVAFMGIDGNTVKYTGNREALNQLRTLITADPTRRIIYFAPLGGSEAMGSMLTGSLTAIGRSVEVINGLSSNDEVLTPDLQHKIKTALSTNDFVIVTIPAPEAVNDIENLVDADNAALLVSLPAKAFNRKRLKSILHGQSADKVFTIIDDSK